MPNIKFNLHTDPFRDKEFAALFDELYSPLCRFCMRFVNDADAAEDIVQEQFVYIWQHRERLKVVNEIKAYLYTAVKHRSISYLKKHFHRNIPLDDDYLPGAENNNRLPDPQKLLEDKELGHIIEQALEALPERCRTIFTLKKFSDLSNKEIAEKLDISVKTVEAQMTIAFKKLTAYISKNWGACFLFILDFLR